MVDIQKLRREISKLKDEMRAITKTALGRENKRMTEDEGRKYCEWEDRIEDLNAQIELGERANKLEMEDADNYNNDDKYNDGRRADDKFKSFGEQLIAVRNACMGRRFDNRLEYDERAAAGMNENIPSEGGYLVQTQFLPELWRKMISTSIFASDCDEQKVGPNANGLSWNELKEDSRANGSRYGGILAYWGSEASTTTASKPQFTKRKIDLEKLFGMVPVTDELLSDTVGLDSLLSDLVGKEFGFQLDDAAINGTGAGMPLGLLSSPALVSVAKESGQTAATVVYENVKKLHNRLIGSSMANAVWYINQDVETELESMALAVGTGGVPVYMPANGISDRPYGRMYGRPVKYLEQCAALGTVGDIIFADPTQYRFVKKGDIKKDVSMHVYFSTDQQAFRFILRVNGEPLWTNKLTAYKGSTTRSPYVALATRS